MAANNLRPGNFWVLNTYGNIFHNHVGIQKRSRDMGERGFYGDTFSDGFGAFKTLRKRQQHYNLRGKKVLTDLSANGIDPVEVWLFYFL